MEGGFVMNSLSELENPMYSVPQGEVVFKNPLINADRKIALPGMKIDPVSLAKQTYMDLVSNSRDPFNRRGSDLVDLGKSGGLQSR